MKSYFEHYPDLLMFDGTYSLNDRRLILVILLVIDGNSESQIAGLFLVQTENAETFNALFDAFKQENPEHARTEVILTDKHGANLNVIQTQFPNAAHHLCVFHVAQAMQRKITTKQCNISAEQRKLCLDIMNKMIYSNSQQEFDDSYAELKRTNLQSE